MEYIDLWRGFVLAAPAIVFGLLTIWAAVSQYWWFWRIAVVLAACALMLPTVAYQLAVFGLVSGVSIVLISMLVRTLVAWRRNPASRLRFGLAELLLWTAVVGAIAGIASYSLRRSPPLDWRTLVLAAAVYALSIVAVMPALYITESITLRVLRFLAILGLSVVYAVAWQWLNWLEIDALWASMGSNYWPPTTTEFSAILQIGLLWLALAAWSYRCRAGERISLLSSSPNWKRMTQRIAQGAMVVVIAGAVLPTMIAAGWLYYEMARPAPKYPAGPSGENHYRELAALAMPLATVVYDDVDERPMEDLVAFHEAHHATLQQIEMVLQKPCYLPLATSKAAWINDMDAMSMGRDVGRAYAAVGEMHERNGNTDAAAEAYVQPLLVAQCSSRGGLDVDSLIAGAIEAASLNRLRRIRTRITAERCRSIARQCERIDAQRESWFIVCQRDMAWMDRVWGWEARLLSVLGVDDMDVAAMMRDSEQRRAALLRLTATELAILAFHAQRARWPTTLDELTPQYLTSVPQDPYRKGPLCYRPVADGYTLYSVGSNGIDDGGVMIGYSEWITGKKGDAFLDAFDVDDAHEIGGMPTDE